MPLLIDGTIASSQLRKEAGHYPGALFFQHPAEYGRAVFGIAEADDTQAALAAIERTEDFLFNQMGLSSKLHEVGIEDEENFAAMAKKAAAGCVGSFVPLEESDIVEIYRAAL